MVTMNANVAMKIFPFKLDGLSHVSSRAERNAALDTQKKERRSPVKGDIIFCEALLPNGFRTGSDAI